MKSLFALVAALGLFATTVSARGTYDYSTDWRTDTAAQKSISIDQTRYVTDAVVVGKKAAAYKIDENEFREKLEALTGLRDVTLKGVTTRIRERGGEAGRSQARHWLTQELAAMGYQTSLQAYSTGFTSGANVIAERMGNSGKVLIISSHMDSMTNAGADDDGSGTIAALLIAKALKELALKNTLRIVFFDNEEQGLIGSGQYVRNLDVTQIIGDVHLEMMAFNSRKDGQFHLIDCDRSDSVFMTTAIMTEIQTQGLRLTRNSTCTTRSDHGSFWKRNIPAVVISENFFGGDGDTCYHAKCDVLDSRLDLNYAAVIATGVAGAAAKLVQ